jgi:cysteine synthase A
VIKRERPGVQIVAVEPAASAVLSGGPPGLHGIQGIGAGFVPGVLDRSVIDRVVTVSDVAAERMATRLAREEGLLVGPSSGANVHAACEVAAQIESRPGAVAGVDLASGRERQGIVLTVLCDTGERYLF